MSKAVPGGPSPRRVREREGGTMVQHPEDPEIDPVDQAEQERSADPADDEGAPEGGPDLVDEADWIDQRVDAAPDDDGGREA